MLFWSFLDTHSHFPQCPLRLLPTHCWFLRTKICVQVKPSSHPLVFARNSHNAREVIRHPRNTTDSHPERKIIYILYNSITHTKHISAHAVSVHTHRNIIFIE